MNKSFTTDETILVKLFSTSLANYVLVLKSSNYPKTSFVPNRAERGEEKKLCASNQKETLLFSQIAKMSNKRFVIEKLHALNCVYVFLCFQIQYKLQKE